MELRQFFRDVLPPAGYFCTLQLPQGRHRWCTSTDELADLAVGQIDRQGMYFATAAFATDASRKQANVQTLRALRLDIDAGAAKHAKHGDSVYPTQAQALAATVGFCRAATLPPTYIVSSGEGLHVYFCLTEPAPPEQWTPVAQALQAIAEAHDLRADSAVTTDTARVLRIPGTPHPNGRRVQILRRLDKTYTLDELRRLLPVAPERHFDSSINDELDLDTVQGPPSSALLAAGKCGALRHVAETRGDVSEPLWRAMLGLVKHCSEGRDLAHEWSLGHPEYALEVTDRKYDAWEAGPTTCAEFSRHAPQCATCPFNGQIKSPIVLGRAVAETVLEAPPQEAPLDPPLPTDVAQPSLDPWDGCIPEGFSVSRTKAGAPVLVMVDNTPRETPTGETIPTPTLVPFTHDIFWFGQWAEASNTDDTAQVVLYTLSGSHVRRYELDQTAISSPHKLMEYLGGKAIHTTTHKKAPLAMQNYAKAQLRHIYHDRKTVKIADRLGLRTLEDGTLVAAHGPHIIFPDGTIREAMLSAQMRQFAASWRIPLPPGGREAWGPEVWPEYIEPRARHYVRFMQKHYGPGLEKLQLAITLTIASPLMAFVTGEYIGGADLPSNSALTVSLYSRQSARGKTAVAKAAMLAYGAPSQLASDTGKAGASTNARIGALSLHGTMPSVMDEVGDLGAGETATLISAVANGTGKRTMTQVRSMRHESTWALINIATTNVSQRDLVSSGRTVAAPVLYRMLELDVDDLPEYDVENIISYRDDLAGVTRESSGALGAVLHREICKLGLTAVSRLVLKCVARAEQLLDAGQTDRFQSRALGAMIATDLILRRQGLALFDLAPLVKVFREAYDAGQAYIAEATVPDDPLAQLAKVLIDLAPHTIVTDETPVGTRSRVRLLNTRMPDNPVARHCRDTGHTWLSADALQQWARERGIAVRNTIEACRKRGVLISSEWTKRDGRIERRTRVQRNLTFGLDVDMGLRVKAYTVDVPKLNAMIAMDFPDLEVLGTSIRPGEVVEEPLAANE